MHDILPKLLIVDDEPNNLYAMRKILESLSITVIEVESGQEALSAVLRNDFFLILLDVQMPDMNGFETAELIHSSKKDANTPIIFLTAYSQSDDAIVKGYDVGAVDYIQKPIIPEILLSKIDVFQRLWQQKIQLLESKRVYEKLNATLYEKNLALKESNQSLKNFSHVVSHDLKQPLSTVIGYCQRTLTKEIGQLSDRGREMLEQSISSAKRMATMMDSILAYAALDSDIEAGAFTQVNLQSVFDNVVVDLNEIFVETGATITARDLPVVRGNENQLYQVFQNVISNALKYRRSNIKTNIMVRGTIVDEAMASIEFVDNGVGFEPYQADDIFQPFFRLGNVGDVEGSGIGMGTTMKIVKHHGGSITATGMPDEGATFTIQLPRL
ncbi:MAG: hybrid sensor histidine kinase/response regulator [Moraxellaceae bacterium]|nr:MAG: hybrid sensor histidine kinase/response regulator [Moraxellaceae bacterium]